MHPENKRGRAGFEEANPAGHRRMSSKRRPSDMSDSDDFTPAESISDRGDFHFWRFVCEPLPYFRLRASSAFARCSITSLRDSNFSRPESTRSS